MKDRQELKSMLPYGYIAQVASKAGVSTTSVSKYLNGKMNSERIELAVLEVLAELSKKKKELLAQIAN